jgi:soluble lytic murein transglycosylase
VGDAIFLLGTALFERGATERALGAFEAGRKRPMERAWHRAGRFDYFTARTLDELGRGREAEAMYRSTLERAPGGYYAALALARLGSGRPAEAKRVLDAYLASAPGSSPPSLPASAAREPAWAAALAATRAGDPEGLTIALDALGVGARTASEAALYVAAELHARVGDAAAAHRILRTASEIEPGGARNEAWSMRDAGPRGDYRRAWELAYPRAHADAARFAAKEAGIPLSLVFAIAREESAFDPRAVSRSDARGLMQLLPVTGERMARGLGLRLDRESLFDPAVNTRLGSRFLAQLRSRFSPAEVLAIPGYNAGPGAPARWLEERPGMAFDLWVEAIPYAETKGYTKRVISSLFVYEALFGGAPDEILAIPLALSAPAER